MLYNLHTHQQTVQNNVLEIVNQYPLEIIEPLPYFSVGIHPYHSNTLTAEYELEIVSKNAQKSNCLAIGECGLDKKIDIPLDTQLKVFIAQIKIAEYYNKPIILHCVSAYQEIVEIKKKYKIQVPLIIHGFAKSSFPLAQNLIKQGFYLSFGKHLLVNDSLAEIFKNLPLDRCFLETDSTTNATINDIYKKAQAIKGLEVTEIIANNFKKVFNI